MLVFFQRLFNYTTKSYKCKGGENLKQKRQWLRDIRELQKLSMNAVAREVDITSQFYWYIETGQRRPSPELAKKIADYLGFDWKLFYEISSEQT